MSALLFSGGWDSIACFYRMRKLGVSPTLLFFDYGQIYSTQEYRACDEFAAKNGVEFQVRRLSLQHDQERRNFFLIAEAKRLGHDVVISGSRNPLPFLDKYRDSNWLSLKVFASLMNVRVVLPVVGWTKPKIVRYVLKNYTGTPYNCYLAGNDYRTCPCPNCVEIKKVLR